MKKLFENLWLVLLLLVSSLVCQGTRVNANVARCCTDMAQASSCPNCGSQLVVRSKIVYKPGNENCIHCGGYGYNVINKQKWTCHYCEGTGKKLIQVEIKWLHCNDCGNDYDYQ